MRTCPERRAGRYCGCMSDGAPAPEPEAFQRRLQRLLERLRQPNGRPMSYRKIAERIREMGLEPISATYLSQLATGPTPNPTIAVLNTLARFFGIPTSYFTDDELAGRVDEQLDRLAAEQQRRGDNQPHEQLAQVSYRMAQLSPEGQDQVRGMLDYVYRLEQQRRSERDAE